MRSIKVGTRKSQLAMTQTKMVVERLKECHPDVEFELVPYKTQGDRLVHVSLQTIGGKGVFVNEIEQALLNQDIDIAIHSLKDVPSILVDGCTIGAIPEREDVRDCLIFREEGMTLETLPQGAVVGTSSIRRQVQLQSLRSDLQFKPLRGNIDSRIRKLQEGECDAIVLAAAGLKRIGYLDQSPSLNLEFLDPYTFIPAVSQGALAVECREDDEEVLHLLAAIHDQEVENCIQLERSFLSLMNADCTFPVGAHAQYIEGQYQLKTMLADGKDRCLYVSLTSENGSDLPKLALEQLMEKGALIDKWWEA